MRFADRADAGRVLAGRLTHLRAENPLVLGLPRGGVPVAAEVATRLGAEVDVVLVRKVGAPGHPELAVGAVGEGDVTVHADDVLRDLDLAWSDVAATAAGERAELRRRAELLRAGAAPRDLAGRTVILVDDGVATGSTMAAAVRVVRGMGAARVVVAVPVAPPDVLVRLGKVADEVVCPLTPQRFVAVGYWYEDFNQVQDSEVRAILGR
ncbi:putative phosphoribosyl transferase [Actinokineospora alba]|uniref:Putative phosphoribosyl transferase n=1 Tax=Actinokineospora alba TaxID=504798 RepID=A0A1H0UWU7_9PSEU|nr:phosphoribosyltransferase family protein [Actinokineospora alba]TDP69012.1 putative phosphoribosyltransferase [Actinokineospora alba]SDI77545.1 putative phosphoribosyl transferase [Actinokineospora alba]SDP70535.1 putative phosphoribosyl transferase [Actinokineospora alba]